jgi:hypothetical protein
MKLVLRTEYIVPSIESINIQHQKKKSIIQQKAVSNLIETAFLILFLSCPH